MKPFLPPVLNISRIAIKVSITGIKTQSCCNQNLLAVRKLYTTGRLFTEEEKVRIGSVFLKLFDSKNPELVPSNYANFDLLDQSTLKKLRWMLQKHNLGQDIFLIGPPGPEKFRLANIFAQLTNHEAEYVSLSRDTTESDLKQRREIKNGTAIYQDQAAVKAALHGRLLVLDGIEKAERNVLPVLNNLLENREMPLEDGRLLVSASRYDKLLESNSPEELTKSKVIRVDDRFRVIALGLPVPKYRGHPLDPPLRSRFQAIDVGPRSFKEQLFIMKALAPHVLEEKLIEVASFGYAVNAPESKAQGLPDFPVSSLPLAAQLMETNSNLSAYQIVNRLYPYQIFLTSEGHKMVEDLMNSLNIKVEKMEYPSSSSHSREPRSQLYCPNSYHDGILHELESSLRIHDICLVGPRGSGKSTLVRELASRLSVDVEPIMLYQDMSARDLWQQRSTLPNGDTIWRPSILFNAVIEGKIAVFDGLHRLNADTLATVQRLIHEREAQLFDGSRLYRHDRYEQIKSVLGCSDEQMREKKLFRVHQDFKIVALAEPPGSTGKMKNNWLTPETTSMFFFHQLRPLRADEEIKILEKLVGGPLPQKIKQVIKVAQDLRKSDDLSSSLSTRQLFRIAKRFKEYPSSDVFELVEKACMARFLPRLPQAALYKTMEKNRIVRPELGDPDTKLSCFVHEDILTIGKTSTPLYRKGNQAKVPDVIFYDTKQHLQSLESLLQDFLLGEHLLLVGNQGVGKNRLIDRLLSLLNRPREYIQLHRDTTVQSLTTSPQLDKGIIKFHDSPLVRAAREGSVLVVDEADKAPTQVTCILKTLIENGEMLLSDGRRIFPSTGYQDKCDEENIIRLHPDFQMIVLANRPGFPFLGNDFFAALGDVFSVHVVENPTFESELALLKNFGPSLSENTLRPLVKAFSQLRALADEDQLNYPYSTREVINIVKHLEKYPEDGVIQTVANVFDFDAYSVGVKDVIQRVFHQNGIPLGSSPENVALAVTESLPSVKSGGQWKIQSNPVPSSFTIRTVKWIENLATYRSTTSLAVTDARLLWFTEQKSNWKLPLGDVQQIHDVTADQENGFVHILATRPAALFSLDVSTNQLTTTALDRYLESGFNNQQFRNQTTILKGQVIVFDPQNGKLFTLDPGSGSARVADYNPSLGNKPSSLTRFGNMWSRQSENNRFMLVGSLSKLNSLVFYEPNGQTIELFNPEKTENLVVDVGFKIGSLFLVSEDKLLVQENDTNRKYIFDVEGGQLKPIEESQPLDLVTSNLQYHPDTGSVFTIQGHYGALMHIPENSIDVWPGDKSESDGNKVVLFPQHHLIITPVSFKDAPDSLDRFNSSGVLRVADLKAQTLRYIPLPKVEKQRRYTSVDDNVLLSSLNQDCLISVDMQGNIRLWEITYAQLAKSLNGWKQNFGENLGQLTIERQASGELSGPKVGKIDPTGAPHVGGNTWAGGTGGRDTAGLGGRGGPYRLDAGHPVHQVSDEAKAAVPEEIRKAAREMGQKAYQERLKQIQMDPLDAELYEKFSKSVHSQVQALRNILGSLQARGKERQWMKHQTHGDFDDSKIIEGLTGEKNIYRRRGEREPELGAPAVKPKHLRLLVDVSGSMYRFNGHDRRLEREMAAVLLFMEALEGYSDQWRYDVIGHSGETFNLELVKCDRPPANEKKRFEVLLNMHAHSQFCLPGDHTVEATRKSIEDLTGTADVDEAFVILLSDANLSRYGIPPRHLAQALAATENVRSAVIFIGSLGDQAQRLSQELPSGSAYVCMDLEKLPQILQEIFTSVILTT